MHSFHPIFSVNNLTIHLSQKAGNPLISPFPLSSYKMDNHIKDANWKRMKSSHIFLRLFIGPLIFHFKYSSYDTIIIDI